MPDDSLPSMSTDIERANLADLKRVKQDATDHAARMERSLTSGGTERVDQYKSVLLTQRQIDYLILILSPYKTNISEECRVKLESA
jgi:hypothetical protein